MRLTVVSLKKTLVFFFFFISLFFLNYINQCPPRQPHTTNKKRIHSLVSKYLFCQQRIFYLNENEIKMKLEESPPKSPPSLNSYIVIYNNIIVIFFEMYTHILSSSMEQKRQIVSHIIFNANNFS